MYACTIIQKVCWMEEILYYHIWKGNPPSADLRYGEADSIGPSTLFFAVMKG